MDPALGAAPTTRFGIAISTVKCEDAVFHAHKDQLSLFGVADGHNGAACATHAAAQLPVEFLEQLAGSAPNPLPVRQAMGRAFLATEAAYAEKRRPSGCTLTAAVLAGWTLTVANVGDSKAILDTGAEVFELTTDHRLGESPQECARLLAAGGRLARLNKHCSGAARDGSEGVGPLRLWPGGVMVGRAMGDSEVGPSLLAHPHIKQVRVPPAGARLIIASDGLWDMLPPGRVARMLRSLRNPASAAQQAVSAAAAARGGYAADDCTVCVVDILPDKDVDFRQVSRAARGSRGLLSSLSSVSLSNLAAAGAAAAAPLDGSSGSAEGAADVQLQQPAPRLTAAATFAAASGLTAEPTPARAAPRRSPSSGGLFSCFSSRPSAVLEGDDERSVHSSRSVHSVRSSPDPSASDAAIRLATTVEVIAEVDTYLWGKSDWGSSAPLPGGSAKHHEAACIEAELAKVSLAYSPRGVLGGLERPRLECDSGDSSRTSLSSAAADGGCVAELAGSPPGDNYPPLSGSYRRVEMRGAVEALLDSPRLAALPSAPAASAPKQQKPLERRQHGAGSAELLTLG